MCCRIPSKNDVMRCKRCGNSLVLIHCKNRFQFANNYFHWKTQAFAEMRITLRNFSFWKKILQLESIILIWKVCISISIETPIQLKARTELKNVTKTYLLVSNPVEHLCICVLIKFVGNINLINFIFEKTWWAPNCNAKCSLCACIWVEIELVFVKKMFIFVENRGRNLQMLYQTNGVY